MHADGSRERAFIYYYYYDYDYYYYPILRVTTLLDQPEAKEEYLWCDLLMQ